jgi:hypothetical protein
MYLNPYRMKGNNSFRIGRTLNVMVLKEIIIFVEQRGDSFSYISTVVRKDRCSYKMLKQMKS